MIYAYTKVTDQYATYLMSTPEGSTELATVEGVTYVHVPDSEALPDQPEQIDVAPVTLTAELLEQIKRESTHVQLIDQRVKEMIAAQYSIEDEIKLIRTAPSEEFDVYNDYAESCRQWGRDQKAALGLVEAP